MTTLLGIIAVGALVWILAGYADEWEARKAREWDPEGRNVAPPRPLWADPYDWADEPVFGAGEPREERGH